MKDFHKMTDQERETLFRNLSAIAPHTKRLSEAMVVMHQSMFPVITPEQRAINSAASFGLFPNVSEEVLRREWQHYRHLEPSFRKWLEFMHAERSRSSSKPKVAKENEPGLFRIVLKQAWPTLAILGAIWTAALILIFSL